MDGCMDRWLCGRGTLKDCVDGYKKKTTSTSLRNIKDRYNCNLKVVVA